MRSLSAARMSWPRLAVAAAVEAAVEVVVVAAVLVPVVVLVAVPVPVPVVEEGRVQAPEQPAIMALMEAAVLETPALEIPAMASAILAAEIRATVQTATRLAMGAEAIPPPVHPRQAPQESAAWAAAVLARAPARRRALPPAATAALR
jgi:hypothetical protein